MRRSPDNGANNTTLLTLIPVLLAEDVDLASLQVGKLGEFSVIVGLIVVNHHDNHHRHRRHHHHHHHYHHHHHHHHHDHHEDHEYLVARQESYLRVFSPPTPASADQNKDDNGW